MRNTFFSLLVFVCGGAAGFAEETPSESPPVAERSAGAIDVRLSGFLSAGTTSGKLVDAGVKAGGTFVGLDWSRSPKIHRELLFWTEPHAGAFRRPYAEITGRMLFLTPQELARNNSVILPGAMYSTAKMPVVVVESIQVYLADHNGRRRGTHPDHGVITADETRVDQPSIRFESKSLFNPQTFFSLRP